MKRPCHDCGRLALTHPNARYCRRCGPRRGAVMTKAMSAVQSAVRDRILPNLRIDLVACMDCGERATQYDHRDYSKPLEVAPVCRPCNQKRGPSAPLGKGAAL